MLSRSCAMSSWCTWGIFSTDVNNSKLFKKIASRVVGCQDQRDLLCISTGLHEFLSTDVPASGASRAVIQTYARDTAEHTSQIF